MKRGSDTYTHAHAHSQTHTLPPYKQQSNHVPSCDFLLKKMYRLYSKSVVFTSSSLPLLHYLHYCTSLSSLPHFITVCIYLILIKCYHHQFPHLHHCLHSLYSTPLIVLFSFYPLVHLSTTLFVIFTKLSLFPPYSQLSSYSPSLSSSISLLYFCSYDAYLFKWMKKINKTFMLASSYTSRKKTQPTESDIKQEAVFLLSMQPVQFLPAFQQRPVRVTAKS